MQTDAWWIGANIEETPSIQDIMTRKTSRARPEVPKRTLVTLAGVQVLLDRKCLQIASNGSSLPIGKLSQI